MVEARAQLLPQKSFTEEGVLEMSYFLKWYEIFIEINHSVTSQIDNSFADDR